MSSKYVNEKGYVRRNNVLKHRTVLRETVGDEPQFCFWCDRPLSWEAAYTDIDNYLVVDHWDHDRTNNDPDNLLPSCIPCNAGRHK